MVLYFMQAYLDVAFDSNVVPSISITDGNGHDIESKPAQESSTTPGGEDVVLRINKSSYYYGEDASKTAITDIDFTLQRGEYRSSSRDGSVVH